MKTLIVALMSAGLIAAMPSGTLAAPPDYTAYLASIDEINDFLYSDEFCELIGYKVDTDAVDKLRKPAFAEAVKAGIDYNIAVQMADGGWRVREQQEKDVQTAFAKRLKETVDKMDADASAEELKVHYNYIDAKCVSFVQSPRLKAYITAPVGDEISDGYMRFVSLTMKAMGVEM